MVKAEKCREVSSLDAAEVEKQSMEEVEQSVSVTRNMKSERI